jgi:hypothetical protein
MEESSPCASGEKMADRLSDNFQATDDGQLFLLVDKEGFP